MSIADSLRSRAAHAFGSGVKGFTKLDRTNRRLDSRRALVAAARAWAEPLEVRTMLSAEIDLFADAGPNVFYIRRVADTVQIFHNQPLNQTPVVSVSALDADLFVINNVAADASVTVDYSGGDPIAGGLSFYGSYTGGNRLTIANANNASINITPSELSVETSAFSDVISYGLIQNFSFTGNNGATYIALHPVYFGSVIGPQTYRFDTDLGVTNGPTSLHVLQGATASFRTTQHLQSLVVDSGGKAVIQPTGGQVLDTNTLTVNGVLNLNNNDLLVNTPAAGGDGQDLLQEKVAAGMLGTSTQAIITCATDTGMTLGVAPVADLGVPMTSLDGQPVPSTALVAVYTFPGDACLTGTVNFADLGALASNFNQNFGVNPPRWYSGDFNYDGYVNGADLSNLLSYYGGIAFAAPTPVTVGTPYTITLPALNPYGNFPATRWDMDWGDGAVDSYTPDMFTGGNYTVSHTYTTVGSGVLLTQMIVVIPNGVAYREPATALAITPVSGVIAYSLPAGASDNIVISADTSGGTIITDNGTQVEAVPTSSLLSINITGDTAGSLTVDFTNGNPLPPSGLSTDSQQINFTGSSGADTLYTTATTAVFGTAEIRHPASSAVTFLNAGAGDNLAVIAGTVTLAGDPNIGQTTNTGPTVIVNSGASVLFTGSQHLSALDILPGGVARMVKYGSNILTTNALNLSAADGLHSGGLLDLADNDLIVRNGNLSTIAGLLTSGYDGGWWDAAPGNAHHEPAAIDSTSALNDALSLETLGYAQVGSGQGELPISRFDDQAVNPGDVVVKFTFYGDANLDGAVDNADQQLIDYGYAHQLTGWTNGDFNYDGAVNGSDYNLSDATTALGPPAVSGPHAVLEDSSVALNLTSGQTYSISSWKVIWTDINGGIISTATFNGATALSQYPTNYMPEIIAEVIATSSNGLIYKLPKFVVSVAPLGYSGITGGPGGLVTVNNFNATATQAYTGTIATFNSTADPATVAGYTASINWGDGVSSAGTIASQGGIEYSITGTHTYAAPDTAPVLVQIDNGSGDPVTGLGTATVADRLIIANPATAVLESDGVTVDLSALGQDAAGASQLSYAWTVTSSSSGAPVTFDDNNDNPAQSTFATLSAAGTYTFSLLIKNSSGQSVSSDLQIVVDQVFSDVSIAAPVTTLTDGDSTTFKAIPLDQFGTAIPETSTTHWSAGGVITQGGVFTAPDNFVGTVPIIADVLLNGIELGARLNISVTSSVTFSVTSYPWDPRTDSAAIKLTIPPDVWPNSAQSCIVQVKQPGENFYDLRGDYAGSIQPNYFFFPHSGGTYSFRIATFSSTTRTFVYTSIVSCTIDAFIAEQYTGVPPTPVHFEAAPANDPSGPNVSLTWDDVSSNETSFVIERSIDEGSTYSTLTTTAPDVMSFIDYTAPANQTINYLIYSINASGYRSFALASVYNAVPTAPTGVASIADSLTHTVAISWDSPNPLCSSGFDVQWSSDNSTFFTIGIVPKDSETGPMPHTYTDNSPSVGGDKINYYRVISFLNDSLGTTTELDSAASQVVTATLIAAPVAVDDTGGGGDSANTATAPYQTPIDKPLNILVQNNLLANDYDPQGLRLTVYSANGQTLQNGQATVSTQHGSVAVYNFGGFDYTPSPGFTGTDSFTYADTNGQVQSDPATVNIVVADQPVLTRPDSFQVYANQPSTFGLGLLAENDTNPDNATVTYSQTPGVAGHADGALQLNSDGGFSYTPNAGFSGLDHFSYQVSDHGILSNPSTVILGVGTEHYVQSKQSVADVKSTPAQVATFPSSLQGLWNSWQAAQDRLKSLLTALQNFGQAAKLCTTIDDTSAGTPLATQLIDAASARQDLVTQAYNTYTLQQQAAVSLAGSYMRSKWYASTDDAQAINAISALPIKVLNIGPSISQLAKYRAAFENFANGADFMVANTTFVVEAAKDTHDALQTTIQTAGIISIAVTGAELFAEGACDKFIQFTVQQMVNTASAAVTGYIAQNAIVLAGKFVGINPDYLRIGADAMQVFFLVKAMRAEKLARGANCFSSTTLVDTTNHGNESISQLHDGERVDTSVFATPDQGGPLAASNLPTAVDPATWRQVNLSMPDPGNVNDSYTMQLLEPLSWITANSALTGSWVNLNLPELQISGTAQVTSIDACPTVESGPGQVVLGTFQHVSHDVVDINLAGESQPLQVTAGHKLWSLDAGGWVCAGNLNAGERLAGELGPIIVTSVTPDSLAMPVYNLDVENDHRYLVTDLGVLAHNINSCDIPEGVPNNYGYNDDNNGVDKIIEQNVGRLQNNLAKEGQLPGIQGVQGCGSSVRPGSTDNPDYLVQYADGTSGYGDLYIADPAKSDVNDMAKRILEKVGQTDNGVVFVKVKESAVSFKMSLLWNVIRKDVLSTTDVRGIILQSPDGSIYQKAF